MEKPEGNEAQHAPIHPSINQSLLYMPVRVLCVADYFLPGFKGGGPIRTIDNMRKHIGDQVEISIISRDRDLGSDVPYEGLEANTWTPSPDGPIYYASPEEFGSSGIQSAMQDREFDLLYLNSFFSLPASIRIILKYRGSTPKLPILLAPRGEFSPGALQLNRLKKKIFLSVVRMLGLYSNVNWHASSGSEKADILRQFPNVEDKVFVAEDPVSFEFSKSGDNEQASSPSGSIRLAFISRISPMKNLDGLLRILAGVSFPVTLHVFGPMEDAAYWKVCERLIEALPKNVKVEYKSNLAPHRVSSVFSNYDLFAFPSHGENFGHVIFEAMRAGTPVVVSDQTPWATDKSGAITVVPIQDVKAWQDELGRHAARSGELKDRIRDLTTEYAQKYAQTSDAISSNLDMFLKSSRPT